MLMYDVTNEESYIKMKQWIREIKRVVSNAVVIKLHVVRK